MTNNLLIPPVGSKGVFKFEPPFDTALNNSQEYTVRSIRMLKEMQDSEENPYEEIYAKYNLTEDDFKSDLNNNVPIVVLSNSNSGYYYVPASKVKSIPQPIGVKYQEVMIAINLGYLPLSFDLKLAKDTIVNDIQATLGIVSTAAELKTSAVQLVSDTEDLKYKKLLETNKKIRSSYRIRYEELKELYEAQLVKLKELEKYIVDNADKLGI